MIINSLGRIAYDRDLQTVLLISLVILFIVLYLTKDGSQTIVIQGETPTSNTIPDSTDPPQVYPPVDPTDPNVTIGDDAPEPPQVYPPVDPTDPNVTIGDDAPEPPQVSPPVDPTDPCTLDTPDPNGKNYLIGDDGISIEPSTGTENYVAKVYSAKTGESCPIPYRHYDKYCLVDQPETFQFVYSYDVKYSPTTPRFSTEVCNDYAQCLYRADAGLRGTVTKITNANGNNLINVLRRDIWCGRIKSENFNDVIQHMEWNGQSVVYKKNIGPFKKNYPVRPGDILVNKLAKDSVGIWAPVYNYGLQLLHILLVMKRDGVPRPNNIRLNFRLNGKSG